MLAVRIKTFYKEHLGLDDDQLITRLAEISRGEAVKKGQRMISMGEQVEGLPILVTGVLRGFVVDESGRDITDCFIHQKGDAIIGCGRLDEPSTIHIEAITDCQIVIIPVAALLQMMEEPGLLRLYNHQLTEALRRHWQMKMQMYQSDAMTRYQWFLKTYPGLEEQVSGKHLASYLGMTPVTLSRLRRKLREAAE